jgi:hypothetical protein
MKATVNVLCYKSKTLSNGEHPLVIRICKDGKKKYQSLGISIKWLNSVFGGHSSDAFNFNKKGKKH